MRIRWEEIQTLNRWCSTLVIVLYLNHASVPVPICVVVPALDDPVFAVFLLLANPLF